ncbi:MAG TPA: YncE family protein, partial [Thermoguttaceae bacterium]|nr:YncE family protein [Thermoguttaceae bacterium]
GPSEIVAAKDGKTLYVLCEDSKQVAVVDLAAGKPTAFWPLPGQPTGLCLRPDQTRLYVTCAKPQGVVCVLELPSGKLLQEIPVGYWACGPSITPDGTKLYVCNRFQNSISVVDLAAGKETARIPATREPIASAITPDGKTLFVANHLPNDRADSYDVAAVVTVVDTASNQASPIRLLNGSTGLRSISVSPDGRYVYVPHILARYQMPTTQLERGWMNTNALTILDAGEKKRINTVLLDDIDLGAAVPWGTACTPDGRWICVSHYGTHELTVIDGPAMLEKLAKLPDQLPQGQNTPYVDRSVGPASLVKDDVPNDLSFLVGLKRRIRLGGAPPYQDTPESAKIKGPRGVVVVGNKAYAA